MSELTGERRLPDRSPNHVEWGGFRVYGDSISIQIMELSGKPRSWDPISYNGHIRDDTTIVTTERVEPWTTLGLGRKSRKIDPPRIFHFHPLDPGQKPPSDNWTKEHEDLQ